MSVNDRLTSLRTSMLANGLQGYIIPSSDPHQSEYVAHHWKSREWASGFTGSAGTVAISMNHAGVWTDSRYFLQAEQELASSDFVLHKQYNQFAPSYVDWLCQNLSSGDKVGIDGWLFSKAQTNAFKAKFDAKSILLDYQLDLVKKSWPDRPELPINQAFEHDTKYCGKSRLEKLDMVRTKMSENNCTHHIITTLDDIAWLFNLRSNDVEFNPVCIAYALVNMEGATLFIDSNKIGEALKSTLNEDKVNLAPYESILDFLSTLSSEDNILVDQHSCNAMLYDAISCKIVHGEMPSRHIKAIKNETEQEHLRNVMVKDGVALANCFYWLENNLGKEVITEYDLSNKLAECRSREDDYFGESFAAIVGYKGNGAIIHYRPDSDTSAKIEAEGVLLVDSGGQYLDGTTDITRTFALSEVGSDVKDAYTRVLKGHIALAMAKFPSNTLGVQLDTFARSALWEAGLNYLHGTGHGVGFFLNVHEPPQGFTAGLSGRSKTKFESGMYTSNEPGYYKEGAFGIRIENLVITQKSKAEGFLEHETITLYPIDKKMIDLSLMSKGEINWLDDYHAKVYEKLAPHLSEEVRPWIEKQCTPLN